MKVLIKYFFLPAFICFLGLNLYAQENAFVVRQYREAIDSENNIVRKIQLLNDYSKKLRQKTPDKAIAYSSEALQLSQESNRQELIILSLISQGEAFFFARQKDKALESLKEALNKAKSNALQDLELRSLIAMGFIHIDSDPKSAYDFLAKAKTLAEQAKNQARLADSYVKLGDWFLTQNQTYEEAFNKYFQAVEIYKNLDLKEDLGLLLENIGRKYQESKDPNKALLSFMEAYKLGQTTNNKPLMAQTLNQIGAIYIDEKQEHESALKYYRECYRISKNYDFPDNGIELDKALQGIMLCYEYLAKRNAEINNKFKADEYDKIYRSYKDIHQKLKSANYQVVSIREGNYTEATPNNPSGIYTAPSPIDEAGNGLENNNETLLEGDFLEKDRDKIIEELEANGELEKDTLDIFDTQKKTQHKQTDPRQNTQETLGNLKNNYWWLGLILVLMIITTAYSLIRLHHREKLIAEQKKKLDAYHYRINRQEVILREKDDHATKKEVELAESYNKLDDALLEKSALTQILQEEVKPPLKTIIEHSQEEKINPLMINQSAKYALNMIASIVDIQNLEKDQMILHKDNYSVYKVARNALNQFSEIIKQKGLTTQNRIKPFHYAEFDEEIIERVFLCLLENAIKYTVPGGKITLDAWQQKKNQKNYISVSIHDNGQRIPNNALSFVFNKYSPEEARPSGLGLAYVKMAVEAHQGHVEVLSSAQDGTSFVFSLPESKVEHSAKSDAKHFTNHIEVMPELSASEKSLLKPFVTEISTFKIYETSLLIAKLAQIPAQDQDNVNLWVKLMKDAIFSLDEEKYNKLMELV
ncbi:MAG: tetratricopeptide repeat-containing sensor histidine kinase [Microscillaceae bacterium]|nr:tetratricopeptide repeat-containing sensor histidine kinase [Microscillaceae bacterium]